MLPPRALGCGIDPVSRWSFTRLYRAFADETAATIAMKFGQPWHAYADLVACNLDRPLQGAGLCGLGPTIAIKAGDRLRIPASWARPPGFLGSVEINPTVLQAVGLDPISAAVATLVQKGMGGFVGEGLGAQPVIPPQLQTMIGNACMQWWRADHPNTAPTAKSFLRYFLRAASWAQIWGKDMAPIDATGFPWAQIEAQTVPQYADVLAMPIDWDAVRTWLATHSSPADPLPPAPVGNAAVYLSDATGWDEVPLADWPWKKARWASIPFGLIPFGGMNLSGVRKAKTPAAQTAALIDALTLVYPHGAANPTPAPVLPSIPPGSGNAVTTIPVFYHPPSGGGPGVTPAPDGSGDAVATPPPGGTTTPPAGAPPPAPLTAAADTPLWIKLMAGAAVLGAALELARFLSPPKGSPS